MTPITDRGTHVIVGFVLGFALGAAWMAWGVIRAAREATFDEPGGGWD